MSFAYPKDHAYRTGFVETPTHVCQFIKNTIEHLQPNYVLDPACGTGNLLIPWIGRKLVGMEANPTGPVPACIKLHKIDFLKQTWWDQPDLILCNPPWSRQVNDRTSSPDRFIRQIVNLFDNKIPIVYLVPMGFRLNQSCASKRWRWLRKNLEITSIISMPLDVYPDTKFHNEIILFNIKGVKPHYFLDMP